MVEQTLGCEATVIISCQAVYGMRDAHLTSSKMGKTVLICPFTIVDLLHSDAVLVFSIDNQRGLDFPDVTEVFNLGIVGSAADYLHRAGRVGRIGQSELGRIISVLQPAEVRVRVRVRARARARARVRVGVRVRVRVRVRVERARSDHLRAPARRGAPAPGQG